MTYTTIIDRSDLHAHLGDPDWVIIDCRFELLKPDWGFADYQSGHIPGAIYADLNKDLAAPITAETGRHPLPEPQRFIEKLSSWGIDAGKQVVVYDTVAGAFASRLWWMLRLYGHSAVAVLAGGLALWKREKLPLATGIETGRPSKFEGQPDPGMYTDANEVERIRTHPAYRLIDARSPERYRGEAEPIDTIAGRIPGSVNRFHIENLLSGGRLLPAEELHAQFTQLLNGIDPQNVVVYCGSGVTSCFHLLAMEIAGLPGARLYPGSWSEWIRDPNRPIARG